MRSYGSWSWSPRPRAGHQQLQVRIVRLGRDDRQALLAERDSGHSDGVASIVLPRATGRTALGYGKARSDVEDDLSGALEPSGKRNFYTLMLLILASGRPDPQTPTDTFSYRIDGDTLTVTVAGRVDAWAGTFLEEAPWSRVS